MTPDGPTIDNRGPTKAHMANAAVVKERRQKGFSYWVSRTHHGIALFDQLQPRSIDFTSSITTPVPFESCLPSNWITSVKSRQQEWLTLLVTDKASQ